MKIRHKINLFILCILTSFAVTLGTTGYFAISNIILEDNTTVFTRELENIDFNIRQSYQELVDTNLISLDSYVQAEKQRLLGLFKSYRFGETGQLTFLDQNGQAILEVGSTRETSFDPVNFQQMATSTSGRIRYKLNGRSHLAVFLHSSHWDWLLILTIAEQELFASRDFYLKGTLGFSAVFFLVVVFFSFRLANKLQKRVDLTLACLFKVEQGDLNARISSSRPDEIGAIQSGINAMIETVSSKTHELETTNATLQAEIVERLQIEQALKGAIRAAEKANQAKSAFLSNMSHELRTPLNAILGFSRIMERELDGNDEHKKMLGIINRSGEYLLDTINDILEITTIEAERTEIEETSIDLVQFMEDICSIHRVQTVEKGLVFNLITDLIKQPYLKTDARKLRQILINLLQNAIKFTEKGSVTCRVRSETSAEALSTCRVVIEVEDTGLGISAGMQETLFEPFAREVSEVKSEITGTGLGLAISKGFVTVMGGSITMENKPEGGSLFRVEIPAKIAQRTEVIKNPSRESRITGLIPGQKNWCVLIVENNLENRMMLRIHLENVGYTVVEAVNGKEAVETFRTSQPDFIWMDIRMPVMDGYEATRQIRKLPGGKNVPIIALTASVFTEQEHEIFDAGCNDIVHKPFNESQLFGMMEKHLGVEYLRTEEATLQEDKNSMVLNRKMLDSLPKEFQQKLRQAALEGDGKKVREMAGTISNTQPAAADAVLKLAEEYRLDTIWKMLEEDA